MDDSLYAGSARYYAAGRLPYPAGIAEVLRAGLGLDGRGRLLDVGCGPGTLTRTLAPLFEGAVGVDADAGMVAEARRSTKDGAGSACGGTDAHGGEVGHGADCVHGGDLAHGGDGGHDADRAHVGDFAHGGDGGDGGHGVEWRHLRAEELPAGLGRFRVATFAQSFHWMDRPLVARRVRGMLSPGGAWVHVDGVTHLGAAGGGPLPHPEPPHDGIAALVRRYLGPVRRAGEALLPRGTPGGEADIMRAAGYTGPERLPVGGGAVHERSVDQVVALVFSLSWSAPHLFGARLADFERDLRALLGEASPSGRFAQRARDAVLVVWRP
ncbi:class I SAM-dependent methyltransferase [Phytohabitans suffuscus]|uniref:Methyltransferase n=1 Tax=Phytohabitans suffuscus TaxID=624315 RepID=A0A6F8YYT4_9ACTN|nr:class I SAM-dependent methyltransferase [Phytohabitans suffuscus]BCB91242.1 methyltransferase [Phytohabitans suffuscus]